MGALRNTHALSTTLLESRITSYYLRPSDTKKKKNQTAMGSLWVEGFQPKNKVRSEPEFFNSTKNNPYLVFFKKTIEHTISRCEQYNSRERTNANNCKKWSSQDKREHNQANTELYGFSTSSIYYIHYKFTSIRILEFLSISFKFSIQQKKKCSLNERRQRVLNQTSNFPVADWEGSDVRLPKE